jgi:uncharacterized protein YraI
VSTKCLIAALLVLCVLSAACNAQILEETVSTETAWPVTSTQPVTRTPAPSETPLSLATTQPNSTSVPVDGATSTQVNVRAEPSTTGNILGIIPADMRVEITGKDPTGNWWQINYPQGQGVDGKGWVAAQYVVAANPEQIPVIGGTGSTANDGPVAVVQQQINVRSGPGTGFNSLGTLNPQDVVPLTGKDPKGAWLEIDFPAGAGPEGKGWVNAAFVQARGVDKLPIISETGTVVGTGTPTDIPPTPTVTIVPAREDNDSASDPSARVVFDPAGTQTFMYTGDLSSPQGDLEDWVAFRSYGSAVFVSLECTGNGTIRLEITDNTSPADVSVECGGPFTRIPIKPNANILVHLLATPANDLEYTIYILTVKTRP